MVTVYEDRFFHLRGRHVQHSHGRNSATGVEHSGAMIALMPVEEDSRRLAIRGGEPFDQIHLTLYYLGEAVKWSSQDREILVNQVLRYVEESSPGYVMGRIFGVSHWNADMENPCWVLSIGDLREEDRGETSLLEDVRSIVSGALDEEVVPGQHTPWIPHLCLAYTDDLSLAGELQKRLGSVEFDRIRIAFGGEYTDVPLGGSLTAAAPPLRRNPTPLEIRSRTDFVRIQSQWESAVDAVLADIQPLRAEQREQITAQVLVAAQTDDLDALNSITVSDEALSAVLLGHMTRAANNAGRAQQEEAEEQGVDVPEWSLDNLTAAIGLDLLRSVARVTARVISTAFVQSAVRTALLLIGRPTISPEQAAQEVNEHLSELSEAGPRESIGGAITAAQNEGRRTVLNVAPPASAYVASEILDRNVCGPCRSVDGTEFTTLANAQEQYPSGGYRDCLGGARCRGTIVAVWGEEE